MKKLLFAGLLGGLLGVCLIPSLAMAQSAFDGTWKIEANDNFNISGFFTNAGKKSSFTYMIDKFVFDGIFDPELTFTSS